MAGTIFSHDNHRDLSRLSITLGLLVEVESLDRLVPLHLNVTAGQSVQKIGTELTADLSGPYAVRSRPVLPHGISGFEFTTLPFLP